MLDRKWASCLRGHFNPVVDQPCHNESAKAPHRANLISIVCGAINNFELVDARCPNSMKNPTETHIAPMGFFTNKLQSLVRHAALYKGPNLVCINLRKKNKKKSMGKLKQQIQENLN